MDLKKELLLKEKGNKNDFALKKSLRNIKKRYETKGFQDVHIKDEDKESQDPGVRRLNIVIDEGVKYTVSELKITGADSLPLDELKKNILTEEKGAFSQAELKDDLKAVKTVYFSKGFTNTRVNKKVTVSDRPDKNQKQVAVEIIINEGPRTKIQRVDIQGLSVLSLDEARGVLAMKAGDWYNSALIDDDISALKQQVSEKGYPHVQVTADSKFSKDKTRIGITYEVDQGPKVVVGKIFTPVPCA